MAPADTELETEGGVAAHGLTGLLPYLTGRAGRSGFGSASTAEQVASGWDGTGKVVLITGASCGLGLESARVLASRGARVVLGVRDAGKAQAAVGALPPEVAARCTLLPLDLASLASVRRFAAAFQALSLPLHVLMLNAGIARPPFALSEQGYELQFATNHLGHFLLTQLLLGDLERTACEQRGQGRVVVLSSVAHFLWTRPTLALESLGSAQGYGAWLMYGRSKLCNILFVRELAARLAAARAPVTAVCCHPGNIRTDIVRHWPRNVLTPLVLGIAAPFMKSVGAGAATQVFLATAPEGALAGGEYYADCNVCGSSRLAHSRALAAALWRASEEAAAAAAAQSLRSGQRVAEGGAAAHALPAT